MLVGQRFELRNTGNPWDAQIDIQSFRVKSNSAAEDLDGADIAGVACLNSGMNRIGILQRYSARKPDLKCAYSSLVACARRSGFLPGSPATSE